MKRRVWSTGTTVAVGLLLSLPVPTAAADNPPAKAAYLQYCSACHGPDGKGDGVVSGFMRPHPADLTKLAKKAGGTFSSTRTAQAIDGTTTIHAHGDSDMPVWGELFRQEAQGSQAPAAEARGKVQLIVEYLRTLQEK